LGDCSNECDKCPLSRKDYDGQDLCDILWNIQLARDVYFEAGD
jgi:hypothetical protein